MGNALAKDAYGRPTGPQCVLPSLHVFFQNGDEILKSINSMVLCTSVQVYKANDRIPILFFSIRRTSDSSTCFCLQNTTLYVIK